MNQYSKEIQADLQKMADKYKIGRMILLFEETDIKTGNTNHRAIFSQALEIGDITKNFSICTFAKILEGCMTVSKTFKEVLEHLAFHSIINMSEEHKFQHDIDELKKKGDVN